MAPGWPGPAAASAHAAVTTADAPGGPVVRTTHGLVRGTERGALRTFQGIPYAAPPVGKLRWAPPKPAPGWDGVRAATRPGAPCAQPEGLPIGVPSKKEDCLYLNVTAPITPKAAARSAPPAEAAASRGERPVIVWIHGGSMMYGTGDMYGPDRLAAQGAVVVSMNYRLGVMGFLGDPALKGAEGLGLEDQQAALRWVRANARAFGGDADNVTIMGQSGGGYGVCGHLVSPASAGLFDRAVVQSAPCATGGSRTRAEARAEAARVAEAVGCGARAHRASCLRRKPVTALLKAYGPFNEPRPVAGTDLMPMAPAQALRTGRFHRVPVLVGVTHDEERGMVLGQELAPGGAPMKPSQYEPALRARFGPAADDVLRRYPLRAHPSAGEALATILTDANWSAPTLDTARLLSRWTPTRVYEFGERDTPWFKGYAKPSFDQRAQHMSELAYLFDLNHLFEDVPAAQTRFRDRMTRTWVDFARSGRTDWPAFGAGTDGYVQTLEAGGWRRADFARDHQYGFWKSRGAYGPTTSG
ncbi:carboxylesterase family protein [Streptomyces sp. p1417]|uniref:Carboxylic ester hydrolase n=1 Tax=Streptomyces typhae TaxID=2681492 RepID=A0A6L6WYB7_9ACTN|nr:carboxylesterase family protein [Streptomyces typhae]MVO86495.1 carboxylesterase family protein [Streptomyces typhae]